MWPQVINSWVVGVRTNKALEGDLPDQAVVVDWVPSAEVYRLQSDREKLSEEGSLDVPAVAVLQRLLALPEGFAIVYPPPRRPDRDRREPNLRNLGYRHGLELRFDKLPHDRLMVRIKKRPEGDAYQKLEALTPIEAERRLIADAPAQLRPRRRYELYSAYIVGLWQKYQDDPGCGVLYEYHDALPVAMQQSRLHTEARFRGVRIKLIRLNPVASLIIINSQAMDREGLRTFKIPEGQDDEALGIKVLPANEEPTASALTMEDLQ